MVERNSIYSIWSWII